MTEEHTSPPTDPDGEISAAAAAVFAKIRPQAMALAEQMLHPQMRRWKQYIDASPQEIQLKVAEIAEKLLAGTSGPQHQNANLGHEIVAAIDQNFQPNEGLIKGYMVGLLGIKSTFDMVHKACKDAVIEQKQHGLVSLKDRKVQGASKTLIANCISDSRGIGPETAKTLVGDFQLEVQRMINAELGLNSPHTGM